MTIKLNLRLSWSREKKISSVFRNADLSNVEQSRRYTGFEQIYGESE